MVDIWAPDIERPFRNLIDKDFKKNYKHFLNVRVDTENEDYAVEQALRAAYEELPEQDKSNICKSDLMVKKVI